MDPNFISIITEARTGRFRRELELLRSHPKDERGSVREIGLCAWMFPTLHFSELSPMLWTELTKSSKWSFSGSLRGLPGWSLRRVSGVPLRAFPGGVSGSIRRGFPRVRTTRIQTTTRHKHRNETLTRIQSRTETLQFGVKLEFEPRPDLGKKFTSATRTQTRALLRTPENLSSTSSSKPS